MQNKRLNRTGCIAYRVCTLKSCHDRNGRREKEF